MSVFVNKSTRLLVQGITGREGSFHARQMLEYGTQVVGGVTPGKGGQLFEGKVPVFNTVADAVSLSANTNRKVRVRQSIAGEIAQKLRARIFSGISASSDGNTGA